MTDVTNILIIGATGSIGRLVVYELDKRGVQVRVLIRENAKLKFPAGIDVHRGDIANPEAFDGVLEDIDAVVFTHGANGTAAEHETID